ncbi:MAG TPA: hypothetical protein VJR29_05780 [bacterium]|nr:hypothetical protein [bacterium]
MKAALKIMGLGIFLAGISVANAWDHRPLSITPVFARAEVIPTSVQVSICEGADGEEFSVVRLRGQGPITSEDPRLEGTFFANAITLHNSDGVGIGRDDFEIRDPVTGRVKVKGSADSLDADPEAIKGMVTARLADGSRFWAESTVRLPPPGVQAPVVIEYGGEGPGVPADRAVIVSGTCRALFNSLDE